MRPLSIGLVLAALTFAASPALAAPLTPVLVDTCGQIVPPKSAAYLADDLDCSAFGGSNAVELGKGTSFDLGGYSLTTGTWNGIVCYDGRCIIRNGTVTGDGTIGLVASRSLVENLTVTMSGTFATVLENNSTLRGSTIAGTATVGIYSSNGKKKVSVVDSSITGHDRFGVLAYKIELRNSTVTGNLTDPACTTDALCADLLATRRPKVKESSCGRSDSLAEEPFTPGCLGWCVCTDD